MKDLTQDYIDEEEAITRKPVELYHIWQDIGNDWYYTNGDVAVTYDGESYVPATLNRSSVSYNAQLEVTAMSISAGYLEDPTLEFIAINPIDLLWISVMKLHRDQDPLEADVIFIGQMKSVSFKGVQATINCVGFEHFLKNTVPIYRYQVSCNHNIFGTLCAVTKTSYKTTTVVSIDSTGKQYTSSDFALEVDGYFTGGEVISGNESRTIISHVGEVITLIYKMVEIVDGASVDAYPGCDGRPETCRDKYDNILNFLGFPFIPVENPATRIAW